MTQAQVQTPTQINIFGKWIPIKLFAKNVHVVPIDELKNRLRLCYPYKRYSIPAPLRFILHPSALGEVIYTPSGRIAHKLVNNVYIARLDIIPNVKLTKYDYYHDILQITLLPPRTPPRRTLKLIIDAEEGKATGLGGKRKVWYSEKPVWIACNISSSGRHWRRYTVILTDAEKVYKRVAHVSNAGNCHEYITELITNESVYEYHGYIKTGETRVIGRKPNVNWY